MKNKIKNDGKVYNVSKWDQLSLKNILIYWNILQQADASYQLSLNNILIYLNILQEADTSFASIQVWQCLSPLTFPK